VRAAMFQEIADDVLEELLRQRHVAFQITEGHLRLDHPELRQMARRVGVLRTKSGPEGVHVGERGCVDLALELTAYREVRRPAEKIVSEVHGALRGARYVRQVQRGHAEHRSGSLTIGGGDDRSVHVEKAALSEELMDGEGQRA